MDTTPASPLFSSPHPIAMFIGLPPSWEAQVLYHPSVGKRWEKVHSAVYGAPYGLRSSARYALRHVHRRRGLGIANPEFWVLTLCGGPFRLLKIGSRPPRASRPPTHHIPAPVAGDWAWSLCVPTFHRVPDGLQGGSPPSTLGSCAQRTPWPGVLPRAPLPSLLYLERAIV
jgi:hypothetical protein